MSKLACISETAIAVVFLVMNLEKWLNSLFFSLFLLLCRLSLIDNVKLEGPQASLKVYQFASAGTKWVL
jgi:hypothetical protein